MKPPVDADAKSAPARRKRGRPPREIDENLVIDAIERLFAQGGLDAVTIERTAQEIKVSRATLYRTLPSKAHLLGLLFERMTTALNKAAQQVTSAPDATPRERLAGLIHVQIDGAVQMRDYLVVYFDGSRISEENYRKWRRWTRRYEKLWIETVGDAIESGDLPPGDVNLTTQLILGMTIWVANWYRPQSGLSGEEIAEKALELLGLSVEPRLIPRPAVRIDPPGVRER